MKIQLPTNDKARLAMLRSTVSTGYSDHSAGRTFLQVETLNDAQQMYDRFREAWQMLADATAARHAAMVAADAALDALHAQYVNLCVTLRRNVNRKLLPTELLRRYGVPQRGNIDYPRDRAARLDSAPEVIEECLKAQADAEDGNAAERGLDKRHH